MSDLVQEFMKAMGPKIVPHMASSTKLSPSMIEQIVPQLVPMIITGLKKQKDEFGGEARVDHILNKYGSASALMDIAGLLSAKSKQTPDPTLGGLLGSAGTQAASLLAKQFNLKGNQISMLITMLAPVVLGFLSQKKNQAGIGGVASLLDQNGDGSVLDDVAGFLLKNTGGSGGIGGAVGSLLGGLLGKKK